MQNYSNNGYSIFLASVIDDPTKKSSKGMIITCSGKNIPDIKGLILDISGEWSRSKTGAIFRIENCIEATPNKASQILPYLLTFTSLDKESLSKMVLKYGNDTLKIIEEESNRLMKDFPELEQEELFKFIDECNMRKNLLYLYNLLSPYGISTDTCKKLITRFGNNVTALIKVNPYYLVVVDHFDFEVADRIAINYAADSLERIKAALICSIRGYENNTGSVCMPVEVLFGYTKKLTGLKDMSYVKFQEAMKSLQRRREIVLHDNLVFRKVYNDIENDIAQLIIRLLSNEVSYQIDFDEEFENLRRQYHFVLNEEQKQAVIIAFSSPVFIITGGPGTGKTSVLRAIDIIYRKYSDKPITFTAPTGKAASRISEVIPNAKVGTIHSILNIDEDSENKKSFDDGLVICDESSMIDMKTVKNVLQGLDMDNGSQLGFIGDIEQLESVSPGNVLYSLIESQCIPVVKLVVNYRTESKVIYDNATKIMNHDTNLVFDEHFSFITAETYQRAAEIMTEKYLEAVREYGLENVMCLVPFRDKTESGSEQMNIRLRDIINPASSDKPEIKYINKVFRLGDQVMNIDRNTHEAVNGMIGYITKVDKYNIMVTYADNPVCYQYHELKNLSLAYAITIHKAQGSEYKYIITTLQKGHRRMMSQKLLNTVITRAKSNVCIVGELDVIYKAIMAEERVRYSLLSQRIRDKISLDV